MLIPSQNTAYEPPIFIFIFIFEVRRVVPLAGGATESAGAGRWIVALEIQRSKGKMVLSTAREKK